MTETNIQNSQEAQVFGDRLERISGHMDRAEQWVAERFQRSPHLSSISIDVGVSFGVGFSVTMTWERLGS